jgi:aminoglycoside phosphotransferase (APT) family kinase protein
LPDAVDRAALQRFLPADKLGEIRTITPIRLGLSGAGVYAVTTETGEYVLRLQGQGANDSFWTQHLLILRRAAAMQVAPPVAYVDVGARAIVSARIPGVPLPTVLADPDVREQAIVDVVARLRAVHTIEPTGIAERNPAEYARGVWEMQRQRTGFPTWAADLRSAFDELAALLARDRRRVVSHNDVNPGNVLWDGARTWLVDWEVAALGHPYYDLAAFVTFLGLDPERANALLRLQEDSPLDEEAFGTLAALRQLVALAIGNVFLSLTSDLTTVVPRTREEAPTLAEVRRGMRSGALDLQTPRGQMMLGLAFLRIATERAQ